jgi:hypothetical protein
MGMVIPHWIGIIIGAQCYKVNHESALETSPPQMSGFVAYFHSLLLYFIAENNLNRLENARSGFPSGAPVQHPLIF